MFGSVKMINFRCFADNTVSLKNKRGSLKPNIYLFGENSSGKSSFLLSFEFLKKISEGYRLNYDLKNRESRLEHPTITPFIMKDEALKHFRKNAKGLMILEYEVNLEGRIFTYEMEFDGDGDLVREVLKKRLNNQMNTVYEATSSSVEFGRNVVLLKDIEEIRHMHRSSFGHYSMLSYFSFLLSEREDVQLKGTLEDFTRFVSELSIFIEGHYDQREVSGYFWDTTMQVSNGTANPKVQKLLQVSLPIINELVQSVFPLVDRIDFEFGKPKNGYVSYEVVAYKKTSLGIVKVGYDELPSGFRRFLDLVFCFLELLMGRCVIVDQFDLKIHQFPFLNIIHNIIPKLSGQLIATLDSLDAMNHLETGSIYVTKTDVMDFHVENIEIIAPSQPNHNIRNRYEQGIYGSPIPSRPNNLHSYMDEYLEIVKKIVEDELL